MNFQIVLHRFERFRDAVEHVHQRQKPRIAIFKEDLERFATDRRLHENIQGNFVAEFRTAENDLVVEFQRIVDGEPRLNFRRNLESVRRELS